MQCYYYIFWETGFHYVALASLELPKYTRLSANSQRSILPLPPEGWDSGRGPAHLAVLSWLASCPTVFLGGMYAAACGQSPPSHCFSVLLCGHTTESL